MTWVPRSGREQMSQVPLIGAGIRGSGQIRANPPCPQHVRSFHAVFPGQSRCTEAFDVGVDEPDLLGVTIGAAFFGVDLPAPVLGAG